MIDFSRRVSDLEVFVDGALTGRLSRRSQYEFDYLAAATAAVSLIMPLEDAHFRDGELFAVMDMNLPEGFLLSQLRQRSPKIPPTKMQLLALMGFNGIGRLGYLEPGAPRRAPPGLLTRNRLLHDGVGRGGKIFTELVEAYLSTGSGLAGVQPKILVPAHATIPTPNVLVKAAGEDYPGLAANEFLCLEVARRAGIAVSEHELSDDGELLLVERFDLRGTHRLGFEDVAALMDLRVGGALSDRKYRGSYENIVTIIEVICTDQTAAREAFFDQLALSVLVRNGDAHLKNFGVLYDGERAWFAPLFDVVTTTIYTYDRAGVRVTDRTMALSLQRSRSYPLPAQLLAFARERCGIAHPERRVEAILEAMEQTLAAAKHDDRVRRETLSALRTEWEASQRAWASA